MESIRPYPKFMITRTTLWLRVAYLVERFGCEFFFGCMALFAMLPGEDDGRGLSFFGVLIYWGIIAVISLISRICAAKKCLAPHFVRVKEIVNVDLQGWEYKDGGGSPCVRVRIKYDSFSSYTLEDKVEEMEFRIFTYLDLQNRVPDLKNFVRHILESLPCHRGDVAIGGGDSCSAWVMPDRYRTPWGLVKSVRYMWGTEM